MSEPTYADGMIAEMRRILDAIPQPAIVCNPSERDRLDAELTRALPWNVPKPELMTSTLVPPGRAYWIADTRPFKPEGGAEAAQIAAEPSGGTE